MSVFVQLIKYAATMTQVDKSSATKTSTRSSQTGCKRSLQHTVDKPMNRRMQHKRHCSNHRSQIS